MDNFQNIDRHQSSLFNSALLLEYNLDGNNKLSGPFREYHSNGTLAAEGNFLEGFFHGEIKEYHDTGQIHFIFYCDRGIFDGPYEGWYRNTRKKIEGVYKDNRMHGLWRFYNHKGYLHQQGYYSYGKKYGEYLEFAPDGEVVLREDFGPPLKAPQPEYTYDPLPPIPRSGEERW